MSMEMPIQQELISATDGIETFMQEVLHVLVSIILQKS